MEEEPWGEKEGKGSVQTVPQPKGPTTHLDLSEKERRRLEVQILHQIGGIQHNRSSKKQDIGKRLCIDG